MENNKKEYFIDEGLDVASFGIYEINLVNNKWKTTKIVNGIFGVSDEFSWSFDNFLKMVETDQREQIRELFKQVIIQKKREFSIQYKINRSDNKEERWIAGKGKVFYDENNRAYRLIGTNIDITKYKELEKKRKEQNMFLMTLLDAIPAFVFIKNYKENEWGIYQGCNRAFEELVNTSREELTGKSDLNFNSYKEAARFRGQDRKCIRKGVPINGEESRTDTDGFERWYDVIKAPYFNEKNEIIGIIGIGKDITIKREIRDKQIELKKKAEEYAYVDFLTKTKNRNYFNLYLNQIRKTCNKAESYILIMDINKFKFINDNYGHRVGDIVLQEIGATLNKISKRDATVIRYGGDEFLVFLFNRTLKEVDEYIKIVKKEVMKKCKNNYELGKILKEDINIAIGYEKYSKFESIDELIGKADNSMYYDKNKD